MAITSGRIEIVAGRGSSDITFPLFDLDVRNYDMLYPLQARTPNRRQPAPTGHLQRPAPTAPT